MDIEVVKIFVPAVAAFAIGILSTPLLAHYLYKHRAWKKKAGKGKGIGGGGTPIFDELHKEREVNTPRLGGILIWGSVAITIIGMYILARLFPLEIFQELDFLSRSQTWVPFFALLLGAGIGLIDDLLEITKSSGGLSLPKRLLAVGTIALLVGLWFYIKLDVTSVGIPFMNPLEIGWLIVPFFVAVTLLLYASGTIDGIDGLAGGVFAIIFAAYAAVAVSQAQFDLAALSATIAGATLAFLWFNIPPARFYMTETGSMALTITLAIIAFMTDTLGEGVGVALLPIIALPLVVTVATTLLQVGSKRLLKRKIFKVAPIHHHFEALGWPPYKVVMRYWVITMIVAVIGITIGILG